MFSFQVTLSGKGVEEKRIFKQKEKMIRHRDIVSLLKIDTSSNDACESLVFANILERCFRKCMCVGTGRKCFDKPCVKTFKNATELAKGHFASAGIANKSPFYTAATQVALFNLLKTTSTTSCHFGISLSANT